MDQRLTSHQHRALAVYFTDCFDSVLLELPMSSFFPKNHWWVLRSWCFFSWAHNIKKTSLCVHCMWKRHSQNQNFLFKNETRKQVADHCVNCLSKASQELREDGNKSPLSAFQIPTKNSLMIFMFSVMIIPLTMWWNIFLKWKRTIVIFLLLSS